MLAEAHPRQLKVSLSKAHSEKGVTYEVKPRIETDLDREPDGPKSPLRWLVGPKPRGRVPPATGWIART